MEKKIVWVLLVFSAVICGFAKISEPYDGDFVVVSYNVENLFDTINNPNTADDEFTPEGERKWDSFRYYAKLKNLWKAIASTTFVRFPDIIGFYEVENRQVVSDLLTKTPLWRGHYSIFHRESDDRRGIDVAIVYRAETFQVLDTAAFKIRFYGGDSTYYTRDILYLKGIEKQSKDTLHIFANHWPSRYSGFAASEVLRCRAASVLRACVDSIFAVEPCAKILCMGDFNDNPDNMSVNEFLKARTNLDDYQSGELYNISYYLWREKNMWTYWYQGHGDFLDQVITSGSLMQRNGLYLDKDDVSPVADRFLRNEQDAIFRTYQGPKYIGGYSDHLPMVIRMNIDR